ncbi:hypothetical protein OJ997_07895 [Solirubrobacter phytolaccae]|uniref:Uncharacterized protein n=1 Tax=Solirubrobacter phytolaccae TaxID=1404360 RepID=A0A9X3SE92_9ACTN|nr:hypothetical protein [Solirubrobacter phytolaccae]MDA0180212.1 hypothetical protein [Solirubrobacter phytolaccae]
MRSLLNRRLGLLGTVIFLGVAIAAIVVIAQFLPSKGEDDRAAATPTATAVVNDCKELDPPYGSPPQDFEYAPVDEAKRAETVKALQLDEAEGKVDVRDAKQSSSGLALGAIVGVPSKDPAKYAADLVASVQTGGAKIDRQAGYVIVPLSNGRGVAVGIKGCRTVLISAQDPNATKFLAAAIFSE